MGVWKEIDEQKRKESEEAHKILDEIKKKNPQISLSDLQKEYDKARGKKLTMNHCRYLQQNQLSQ